MIEQPTFADLEYQDKKRKTRREIFLERMDSLIPWQKLEERIRPHYPKEIRGEAALLPVGNAAGPHRPTLLQPERPWDGGPVVRLP